MADPTPEPSAALAFGPYRTLRIGPGDDLQALDAALSEERAETPPEARGMFTGGAVLSVDYDFGYRCVGLDTPAFVDSGASLWASFHGVVYGEPSFSARRVILAWHSTWIRATREHGRTSKALLNW